MKPYIYEYIRTENRHKMGMIIGVKNEDENVNIAYAMCDNYKNYSLPYISHVLQGRFDANHQSPPPNEITQQLDNFKDRCKRYFKTENVDLLPTGKRPGKKDGFINEKDDEIEEETDLKEPLMFPTGLRN